MSPGTLLRTLRHLRAAQWVGQLRRAVGPAPRPRRVGGPPPRLAVAALAVPFLPPAAHVRDSEPQALRWIHREVRFPERVDWEHRGEGPLWAYHLHQMEWLRGERLPPDARLALALDWVERHRRGTGWDGGPISLRTFHWLKLLATPGALPEAPDARARLAASLADQLATLAARPETHLLGNHYLWNLLALVLGGLALECAESEGWRGQADALRAELARQVHRDGCHEERSPMYHALLLENVLDLLGFARASRLPVPAGLEDDLCEVAARMLGAHAVWTHPDGEIALFADSAFGIAARPDELAGYAAALGVAPRAPARAGVLEQGGYVRLAAGPFSLLASVAGPSPHHQPGHAHCDALSFELLHGRARVVTDTGVHEYVAGPRRDASRATRSHATIEVGGRDQAELWASHRIGGRPRVELVCVEPGRRAEATCAGWATPRVVHRRRFEVGPAGVTVHDVVEGPAAALRLALPLAPGIGCAWEEGAARLRLPDGTALALELPAQARWRSETAPCFPSFGVEEPRTVLVGEAQGPGSFDWSLSAPGA